MICKPCAEAADFAGRLAQALGPAIPVTHNPAICADAHIPGRGCTCAHGAVFAENARGEGQ